MTKSTAAPKPAKSTAAPKPVSNDPEVPTADESVDPTLAPPKAETTEIIAITPADQQDQSAEGATSIAQAAANVAAAAVTESGAIDPQAAAIAGRARREAAEASKMTNVAGNVVRQLEDGAVTDRRGGANADKSLAGENLPALRKNEPDPRQGVTTGDLTNPDAVDGEETEQVTFKAGYSLYNRGEKATFSKAEAARLRDLGVAE